MKNQIIHYVLVFAIFLSVSCENSSKEMTENENYTIEIVTFTLKEGADEQEFYNASSQLSNYLDKCEGFKSRKLYKLPNGKFQDIAYWQDEKSIEKANKSWETDTDALHYASFLNQSSLEFYFPKLITNYAK